MRDPGRGGKGGAHSTIGRAFHLSSGKKEVQRGESIRRKNDGESPHTRKEINSLRGEGGRQGKRLRGGGKGRGENHSREQRIPSTRQGEEGLENLGEKKGRQKTLNTSEKGCFTFPYIKRGEGELKNKEVVKGRREGVDAS